MVLLCQCRHFSEEITGSQRLKIGRVDREAVVPHTRASLVSMIILVASASIVIALLLAAGSIELSNKAHACEGFAVPGPPPDEALKNSATVFSGKVEAIQKFTTKNTGEWRVASFEVDRYWKTLNENDYRHLIVLTAIDGGACGYDFEVGKTYLVFARTWLYDPDSLYTGLGHRTQPIENAQEDLVFLGISRPPTRQLSWDEQINQIKIQPIPTGQEEETSTTVISIIGVGAATAGVAAFFSLRRLKDNR